MSEGRIEVTMPRELTRSMSKMDETLQGLKRSFKELYKILHENGNLLTQQTKVIERLPVMVETFQEAVQQQFEIAVLRQLESLVLQQQATLLADEQRVRALQEFLDQKSSDLEKQQSRIRERYQELLGQIAQDNRERRRRLDSHAYELLEEVYTKQIEGTFSRRSLPTFEYLSAHATECAVHRSRVLLEGLQEAELAAGEVEGLAGTFDESLGRLAHEVEPGTYEAPAYVIETTNHEGGDPRTEVRFCGTRRDPESPPTFEMMPGLPRMSIDLGKLRRRLVERGVLHPDVIESLLPTDGQGSKSAGGA